MMLSSKNNKHPKESGLADRVERHVLQADASLFTRTQQLFFFFATVNLVFNIPPMMFVEGTATSWVPYSLSAMALLILWWAVGSKRGHFPLWAEPFEAALVIVVCFGFVNPARSMAIINAALFFRHLFGYHENALLRMVFYLLGYLAILVIPHGQIPQPADESVGIIAGICFITILARILATSMQRHERSVARERQVQLLGAALMSARDESSIYSALIKPVSRMFLDSRYTTVIMGLSKHGPDHLRVMAISAALNEQALGQHLLLNETFREPTYIPEWRSFANTFIDEKNSIGKECLFLPIQIKNELQGGLLVTGSRKRLEEVGQSLATVAFAAGLALDAIRSGERFASLVRNSNDLITVVDREGVVIYQSAATERIFGYTPTELVHRPLFDVIDRPQHSIFQLLLREVQEQPDTPKTAEWRWRCEDGGWLYTETIATNLLNEPSVHGIVLNTRDVTERKVLEERLRHQASHDSLTDLPNRALFTERVHAALARSARSGMGTAVMFIDVDDFKNVNDTLGHHGGDQLLISLARVLKDSIRSIDTAARLGGDEFAVLLEDIDIRSNAPTWRVEVEVAKRILQMNQTPLMIEGQSIRIRTSIGVALAHAGDNVISILHKADLAMYAAKTDGKDRYALYHDELEITYKDYSRE
ncbi:MAG: GGDEF domain-containing protein [Gammaproteobacteria bacterium]|nr:GGDEF domain-containing protein [Gammaproteobacteria bacterium]